MKTPDHNQGTCVRLSIPLAVLYVFIYGPIASPQTQNGEIKGVITDDAGARIPKAVVTATNLRTQIYRTVDSSETGDYVISNLQPGVYQVAVTKQGFQKGLAQEVTVDVNQIVTLDIPLRVGTVTETVNVAAEGALLEAATAQLGTVITEEKSSTSRSMQGIFPSWSHSLRALRRSA